MKSGNNLLYPLEAYSYRYRYDGIDVEKSCVILNHLQNGNILVLHMALPTTVRKEYLIILWDLTSNSSSAAKNSFFF